MRQSTELIIVHCSATPAKMDVDVKEIDRWHRAKGWLKVGYHFVIKRDGTVQKGRDLMEPGAHAKGYNHCSVGVCMVGGMDAANKQPEANFTEAQFTSLHLKLRELREQFPNARVIGHNEVEPAKACPSFSVQSWIDHNAPELRRELRGL